MFKIIMRLGRNMDQTSFIRMVTQHKNQYWLQDASVVVKTELSMLLDYIDPKVKTSKFSSKN
jgi:hypothetical protein